MIILMFVGISNNFQLLTVNRVNMIYTPHPLVEELITREYREYSM